MSDWHKLDEPLTGGCQCGAVRYRVGVQPSNVHVCHCSAIRAQPSRPSHLKSLRWSDSASGRFEVCQKAVGEPFAVICPVLKTDFVVTRGEIGWFHSSALARRGFCRDCGTPLIFDYPDFPDIGVLAGSFDQPDRVPPVVQYGVESRVSCWHGIEALPGDQPTYAEDPGGMLPRIQASNRQHPDHDT